MRLVEFTDTDGEPVVVAAESVRMIWRNGPPGELFTQIIVDGCPKFGIKEDVLTAARKIREALQ